MASEDITPPLLYSAAGVFIGLDTVLVALRLYSRRLMELPLGADDYTCVGALAFVIAIAAVVIVETQKGHLGIPQTGDIDAPGVVNAGIAWYPLTILQVPALGLGRMSILFFYRRVFVKGTAPTFNRATWATILACILWTIAFTFAWIFVCGSHPSYYWHSPLVRTQKCVSVAGLINSFVATDFAFDLVLIVLPFTVLWRLHLTAGRRLGVSIIFILGAGTIAASGVRLAVLVQSEVIELSNHYANLNLELIDSAGIYWGMIEAGLVVLTSCLPMLYTFYKYGGVQALIRSAMSQMSLQSMASRRTNRDPGAASEYHHLTVTGAPNPNAAPQKSVPTNVLNPEELTHPMPKVYISSSGRSESGGRSESDHGNGIKVTQSFDRDEVRI